MFLCGLALGGVLLEDLLPHPLCGGTLAAFDPQTPRAVSARDVNAPLAWLRVRPDGHDCTDHAKLA